MTDFTASLASARSSELGEGPCWDAARDRVLWVDGLRGTVFEGRLAGDAVEIVREHAFDGPVAVAVPATHGGLLVADRDRLVVVAASGERRAGPVIVPEGGGRRMNDGACDPNGRFLVGTKGEGPERLVRVEDDGSLTTIDSQLTLSNGVAWSPNGALLYVADTLAGIIWVRDYESLSGRFGERSALITLPGELPDGLCVDADGNLWVAVWGAGEVRCYSATGRRLHTVHVSAPHTSSVAFVGERLDLLLITTARENLSARQREEYPDSGRLFSVRVGVVGAPTTSWSGSWASADL
jgi:sugar lactone lactonase YvrE